MQKFGYLEPLEGVKERIRQSTFINSSDQIAEAFEEGFAVTTAADNGAINMWIMDDATIYCERCKYRVVVDKQYFKTLGEAEAWFEREYKKIQ